METLRFFHQTIAFARIGRGGSRLGLLRCAHGTGSLTLRRSVSPRRRSFLLTTPLLSLLGLILQLREKPTPPSHELPLLVPLVKSGGSTLAMSADHSPSW
jgi:hypothetical protein